MSISLGTGERMFVSLCGICAPKIRVNRTSRTKAIDNRNCTEKRCQRRNPDSEQKRLETFVIDQANVEPWLRGTLAELPAVLRAVLHALQLAREDTRKWCHLTDEELNARPSGIAPVAFHLRHIGRSADRLLTYIEGR